MPPAKRKRAAKPRKKEPVGILVKTKTTKKSTPKAKRPAAAAAPRRAARGGPVERTRVVFLKPFYEANKDAVKAPLKEHALKWQYLGEGKGRYHREGVNLFVQFLDDGTHYSLWGEDKETVAALLAAWKELLGPDGFAAASARADEAVAKEKQEAESEAMRTWRIGEPQRQPTEPESFYRLRRKAWEARKPTG